MSDDNAYTQPESKSWWEKWLTNIREGHPEIIAATIGGFFAIIVAVIGLIGLIIVNQPTATPPNEPTEIIRSEAETSSRTPVPVPSLATIIANAPTGTIASSTPGAAMIRTSVGIPTVTADLDADTELCVTTSRRLSTAAVEDEERQTGELVLAGTIVFITENVRGDFYSNQHYHISTGTTSGWFPRSGLTDDLSYCEENVFIETIEASIAETVTAIATMEAATVEARDGIPLVRDNLQPRTLLCVIEDSPLWQLAELNLETGYTVQTGDSVILDSYDYEYGEYYLVQNIENPNAHGWIHKSKLTNDRSYCER